MKLTISKYRGRKKLFEQDFGKKEKFFINVYDNDGNAKFQTYCTVESLISELAKDW